MLMKGGPALHVLALVLVLVLAGCLGATDQPLDAATAPAFDAEAVYAGLTAEGAEAVREGDMLRFTWEGVLPAAPPGVPLFGSTSAAPTALHLYDVGPGVGYVEALVESDSRDLDGWVLQPRVEPAAAGSPLGQVLDAVFVELPGVLECHLNYGPMPRACTTPIPSDVTEKVPWGVFLTSQDQVEVPYRLTVTLHPPQHITRGDPIPDLDPVLKFEARATGFPFLEPTMGVLRDGALFAVSDADIIRSLDDGATWEDVTPPTAFPTTFDPYLVADPWTNRVWLSSLYVACSWSVWSDDGGATWVTHPAVCGLPVNDHQKLAIGGAAVPNPLFDGTMYYLFSDFNNGDVVVARSLDGGLTWLPTLATSPELNGDWLRRGGPLAADRDGNVYAPAYVCEGGFGAADSQGVAVIASNDHGATYQLVPAYEATFPCEGLDPGIAIDTAGNAYVAYWGPADDNDGYAVYLGVSQDHGASWSAPLRITPPSLRSFELVDAVAGDEGRVAVTFTATPDSGKGPNLADGWARWYTYVAVTEHALAPQPVWHLAQVQPMDQPIQLGCIWTHGGGEPCRNLLDFNDIQVGPDGRVYVSYTNGCVEPPCETPSDTRGRDGYVAVQVEGPRLFQDRAPWAADGGAPALAGGAGGQTLK